MDSISLVSLSSPPLSAVAVPVASPWWDAAAAFVPVALLLLLSAFFSGSETALFSLPDHQRELLGERHGRAGRRLQSLLGRAPRLLAALLIGNLLVNISASVLATSLLMRSFGNQGAALAVPLMTVALLLAGEITPKVLALRYRERIALWISRPIAAWVGLIRPLLWFVDLGTRTLLRRLPPGRDADGGAFSTPELVAATELAVDDAVLTETEGRFLSRMLSLGDIEAREIMTPRPDVRLLSIGMDRAAILDVARETGFNRYPVVRAEGDLPLGIFHLKDLLDWTAAARLEESSLLDIAFVPESKDVGALLSELRTGSTHLTCVIDEHGDFAGVVSLEDCLETLTGPWTDESDRAKAEIMAVADDRWLLAGTADLRGVNDACGTDLELSPHYATIAGFLMAALGRIPEEGDEVATETHALSVQRMSGHRVASILLRRTAAPPEEAVS